MISLQMSMHSLQTYTPGPAISFLTSFCDLPQKEQQRSSSGRRKFAIFLSGPQLQLTAYDKLLLPTYLGVRLPRRSIRIPSPAEAREYDRVRRLFQLVQMFGRCGSR